MSLEKLQELKEKETKDAKIWNDLQQKAQEEAFKILEESKRFVVLKTELLHTLYKLPRNCIDILLYLRGCINRDTGYKDTQTGRHYHSVWANLDKYYNEGYLVTARTQSYMARELGMDDAQLSRSLKVLSDRGYYWDFGYETIKQKNGKIKRPKVFCLGFVIQVQNQSIEVYLHERGEVKQVKTEEEDDEF